LITFDQQKTPAIRFHKVRGLKQLQLFDFSSTEDLDYKFTDLIETTRIELQSQISSVEPTVTKSVKTVLYYAGHILVAFV